MSANPAALGLGVSDADFGTFTGGVYADDQTAKQLFRERCSGCHELDRIYAKVKEERDKTAAWLHVVTRMRAKAPDWISEDDAERIIDYLRTRTKPKKAVK